MGTERRIHQLTLMMAIIFLAGGSCPNATQNTLPTENAANGQAKYNSTCASCHRLGAFDATGDNSDLKGKGNNIVTNLGGLSAAMNGITLTAQEVADLKAFIATIQ